MEHDQEIDVQGQSKAACLTCDMLNNTLRDVKAEWTHGRGGTANDL